MMTLARLLRSAGAHVDIERACPDLYRLRAQQRGTDAADLPEAILDVVVGFLGSLRHHRIDVTTHSPFVASSEC